MSYRHTQPGTVILITCLVCGALIAAIEWYAGVHPAAIAVIGITAAAAILFSSLTVEVGEGELRWYFGPGLWRYRLPLDRIEDIAIVRNRWWNGFGIRMRPGFRLYNVSGLDAVELRLGPNDIRRIGTDDPRGLADALKPSHRS